MKRALITGHSGFSGSQLATHLRSAGYSVHGFDRSEGGDIRHRASVLAAVRASRPDVVFHLAAAPKSADPSDLYSVSALGTLNLLDALDEIGTGPRVVLVSSSAVYGRTKIGHLVHERDSPKPVTHYGASKLAQEEIAMRYVRSRGLPIVRVRPFNLIGPGLSGALACGAFAEEIVRIERSDKPKPVRTGNLNSVRDFTDIRDVVRAYVAVAEQGRVGSVYNVCSGNAISLEYCLAVMLQKARRLIDTEIDPDRMQADDIPWQVGDCGRLQALTGWRPTLTIEESLGDMLAHRRTATSA